MDIASAPPSKPNSGRIIPHNLHLLADSYNDQETGSVPSQPPPLSDNNSPLGENGLRPGNPPNHGSTMEIGSDVGGETPGGAQPNLDSGYPRDSLDDNYNERPVSNSSADSRGMDDSPVDEDPGDTQDVLSAEKQYQDDLKERVRQSFKDLGMEPEGLLREESGKSGKSKKRKPVSKRRPVGESGADDGVGGPQEDTSGDDGESYPANEPAGYPDDPASYANEPDSYANEPNGYSNEPDGYGNESDRHADEPTHHANDYPDPEEALQDQTTPKGYPDDRGLGGVNPTGDYPDDGQTPRAYPSEGIANSDPPQRQGYNENDYPNNAADEGDVTPVRHPQDNEGVENSGEPEGHPGVFPVGEDQYEDNKYENYPQAEENSNAPGVHPEVGNNSQRNSYPETDNYPNEGGYPNDDTDPQENSYPEADNYPSESGYPNDDNYPPKSSYPEADNYPSESGYPNDGGYPEDAGYPEQGNYSQGGGYPEKGDYAEGGAHPGNIPPGNGYAPDTDTQIPPNYPSRYSNQYVDDEEQYDERNQAQNHEDNTTQDQTPRDSLEYGRSVGVSNDYAPNDSLDYDQRDDAKNNDLQHSPSHREPENNFQDSLEFGHPEPAHEQTYPGDTGRYGETYGDTHDEDSANDPAPYDSLEEEEPYSAPNRLPPQEVSSSVPNNLPPQEISAPEAAAPQQNGPEGNWPESLQHAAGSQLRRDAAERDGYSSNNSSANSRGKAPDGSSAGSRKPSRAPASPGVSGSRGVQDLPPQARRTTPSRSGSRGAGSRGSNRPGYSELARQWGSANQKGSAGSDRSDVRKPQQQSSPQQGRPDHRQNGQSSGGQTRGRSLSNRIRTSPIPADELSAKELLKRNRSKSDVVVERPKFEHSDSQIIRKNGEDVRVAYISDDSGDEGEHFLDEKGSPVDHLGKPLYSDLHGTRKKSEEPKLEFRIKPTPPKQKSPLELQTVNARRTSADDAKKVPHGGKITIARPFPVEEAAVEPTTGIQTGLLNGALPPRESTPKEVQEPMVLKTSAHQEGRNESTLPPQSQDRSTQKDDTDSPKGSASSSRTPFGEVRLRSVGTVMSGKSMGRGRTRPKSEEKEEDPYKDLRFGAEAAETHGRENKAAVEGAINKDLKAEQAKSSENDGSRDVPRDTSAKKHLGETYRKEDFEKPKDYPAVPRGASGGSYQDRGIQYTPQEGQAREQQPYSPQQQGYYAQPQDNYDNQQQSYYPNVSGQDAYNQQPGFPGGPQPPSQYNRDGYLAQQNWEQQPHGAQWNNAHPSQVPQPFYGTGQPMPTQYDPQQGHIPQEEYYDHPHPGYDAPIGRPNFPQTDPGQPYDQQQPYDTVYQNYPGAPIQPARPMGPPQGYTGPPYGTVQAPNRVYPSQGMQPAPGHYQSQDQPIQNEPPSQPRQRGPPKPKPNFIDLNKANLGRGPPRRKYSEMQKKPTPTRINPKKPLPDISRESSQYDEDVYDPGSAHTWAHEDWTRQLIQEQRSLPLRRGHSDTNLYIQNIGPGPVPQGYQPQGIPPRYSDDAGVGYPHGPQGFQPTYNQTYPPQLARNQNGQPYSYSADHATQYARNNEFARPQLSGPPRARVAFADDLHNSFDSDVNPMAYANDGAGAGYQHATKRTSPYQVLPDIPGQPKADGSSPLRKSDPDSYTARLMKQKQPPQYKEYTLKDYRNLKNDIRLGGLGPDLDLITEKQDKVNRQRDYAKAVMEQNKKQLQQTKRLWPKEAVAPRDDTPSKRDIGIEYSKHIPKPRMPTPPEVLHERMYGASSRQQAQEEEEHEIRSASEMARLEELKARHEKEKEEVERLRMEAMT